jgi:hypothetical protein
MTNSESALNSEKNYVLFSAKKRLSFFIYVLVRRDGGGGPQDYRKKLFFLILSNYTSSDAESYADSEYVILFKKYFGQKSGLTGTCPLVDHQVHSIIGH